MSEPAKDQDRGATLRLGIGSYTFGWAVGVAGSLPARPLTALDLLHRARELDVRVVQIADNLPLHRLSSAERSALRRAAVEEGIQVEVGTRGIDPDHLRGYLSIAQEFGSDILRVVVDTADDHPGEDRIVRSLRSVIGDFERAGVRLAIENHDRFTASSLAAMVRDVGSPAIGICLDTANSLGAQEGVRQVAEALAPWLVNLHLKDVSIRRLHHLMGFHIEGAPAGEGAIDIPWLLDFVRARASRPMSVILELWPPPEERLDDTLAKEAEWAASSIRYLRALIPD